MRKGLHDWTGWVITYGVPALIAYAALVFIAFLVAEI